MWLKGIDWPVTEVMFQSTGTNSNLVFVHFVLYQTPRVVCDGNKIQDLHLMKWNCTHMAKKYSTICRCVFIHSEYWLDVLLLHSTYCYSYICPHTINSLLHFTGVCIHLAYCFSTLRYCMFVSILEVTLQNKRYLINEGKINKWCNMRIYKPCPRK